MAMRKVFGFFLFALGGLLILRPVLSQAQTEGGACPALAERALVELGENCGGLGRNSACYGFNRVDATFSQPVEEAFFSRPSDRSELVYLDTIETAPLDTSLEHWGIAVLNVQANLPNTLPGQGVTFILLGEVELDNAVAAENAFQPVDPISITTTVAANLRSGPSANSNIVGSVAENTEFAADALSADGEWVRVLYQTGPAWINRTIIQSEADVSALPAITRENRSPMQAFYFRTGVGDPNCVEAPPSLLVVQGPQQVAVDINANGADIRIGSTIVLMLIPGNRMQLIVVSGSANVGGMTIPAGFKITAPLSEDGQSLGGDWTDFVPLTEEDLLRLQGLENIPANLLHYPIVLPTIEEINALIAQLAASSNGAVVISGQGADCGSFKPTSPLDGLPYGPTTFYWDPAQGATSYRVTVFNESGQNVGVYETGADSTNLVGDTSTLGNGFSFSWQVEALVNGQVICSSAAVTLFREVPPPTNPDVPPPATTPEPTFPAY